MTNITLTIAIAASMLVLYLRPAKAFAIFMATLLYYPSYLVLQLGIFDISVSRIVVGVLLLRCLANTRLRGNIKWCPLDTWVALSVATEIGIALASTRIPMLMVLENRSGWLMDTLFAYMVARFCITNREAMVTTVKWIGIALVPLALLGVIEALTGWQLYFAMMRYCPWELVVHINPRLGFIRAIGPFSHSIMFGAVFVLFLPFVYSLRHERNYWRLLAYILSGVLILGALSSMSSGPWMMVLMIIGCLVLEHCKQWVKPLIIFIVVSCLIVEIISNRPLHHVIVSYANPIGGSGWYRAKLIDVAIEHFGEWWLAGYGGLDPGWGSALGMRQTDITNQYIIVAVRSGLFGLMAFCSMLTVAIFSVVRLYKSEKDLILRSWYWAMGSLIVVLIISFFSCTFFGQTATLFYCILGIVGSSGNLISPNNGIYKVINDVDVNLRYRPDAGGTG